MINRRLPLLIALCWASCCLEAQAQSVAARTDFVPAGVIEIRHVNGVTDSYGVGAASNSARGSAVVTVQTKAVSGETVLIGAGTYDTGATQIHFAAGVKVRGQGDATILTNSVDLGETGPMVRLIQNGEISDLRIVNTLTPDASPGTGNYQACIGVMSTQNADGCVCRNLSFDSDTDNLYIESTVACNVDFHNCAWLTKWDATYVHGNNSTVVRIFGGVMKATGDSAAASGVCEPVFCTQGTVRLFGTDIRAQNATTLTRGIQAAGANAVAEAYGCHISTNSGTGAVYDLYQQSGGTIRVVGCSYDNTKTFGVITQGTWQGVTPTATGLTALSATNAAALANAAGASAGVFPVTAGGTGAATLTGLVKGNGTSAMTAAVAGTDYVASLASPGAIGGSTPASGSFTTLSASSTVSGTGFSTYLASPPAIGGTSAAAAAFTTLSSSSTTTISGGNVTLGNASLVTSPTISALSNNGTSTAIAAFGNWTLSGETRCTNDLHSLGWVGLGGSAGSSGETRLYSDAANTLALRNSTSAQAFNLYNTYTSSTSLEELSLFFASNVAKIMTVKGSGGGSARDLQLGTDSTSRFTMKSTGALLFPSIATAPTSSSNQLYNNKGIACFTNSDANDFGIQQTYASASPSFDKTSNTTLANVTGLTASIGNAGQYRFHAVLFVTAGASGGHKYAVGYTGTATSIVYEIHSIDNSSSANVITSRQTSAGGSAGQTGATSAYTVIDGFILDDGSATGGTLSIQFAQNASNGTASSVLFGSSLEVFRVQ